MVRHGTSRADSIPCRAFGLSAALGECPVWSSCERLLLLVDIPRATLHRIDPESGACDDLPLPARSTALVLTGRRTLVVAMGTSLIELDPGTGTIQVLLELRDEEARESVFNDAKCDRAGRLWIGTRHRDRLPGRSALWRLDPACGLRAVDSGFTVANGIAWSPAGDALYLADSRQRAIFRYAVDGASGTAGVRTEFAQVAPTEGAPDGLTVDAEGGVWAALWGGSSVRRYAPDGTIERTIELPVAYPTSCIFGGRDMDDLYVTSAVAPDDERHAGASSRHDGAVFMLRTGIRGIAETPMQMCGG